jgi:DNA ligase (NAD+)
LKAPFHKVLFALGIRHIGETTAKTLASHFENIDNLISATKEELTQVDDVGEIMADSIAGYFANQSALKLIEELRATGMKFSQAESQARIKSGSLINQVIVISGNFSISRDDIKKMIEEHSGKNTGSVSSKTTLLLAGEDAGPSKLQKAKTLGIKIINEAEFMRLIENN